MVTKALQEGDLGTCHPTSPILAGEGVTWGAFQLWPLQCACTALLVPGAREKTEPWGGWGCVNCAGAGVLGRRPRRGSLPLQKRFERKKFGILDKRGPWIRGALHPTPCWAAALGLPGLPGRAWPGLAALPQEGGAERHLQLQSSFSRPDPASAGTQTPPGASLAGTQLALEPPSRNQVQMLRNRLFFGKSQSSRGQDGGGRFGWSSGKTVSTAPAELCVSPLSRPGEARVGGQTPEQGGGTVGGSWGQIWFKGSSEQQDATQKSDLQWRYVKGIAFLGMSWIFISRA